MASGSDLKNEMRSHEVAIAELNALPSSRVSNTNLLFSYASIHPIQYIGLGLTPILLPQVTFVV